VSKEIQLRFIQTRQEVVNGLAIVLANREDQNEAIPHLEEGEKMYK